ncbi:hypothetical protein [Nocardia africana]
MAGLWLGERRRRRDQTRQDNARYQDGLRDAYLELWDIVEDAHLKMRACLDDLTPETFSGLLADVSGFMIRRGTFIESGDRQLVLEYLFWTNEYMRIASSSVRAITKVHLSFRRQPRNGGRAEAGRRQRPGSRLHQGLFTADGTAGNRPT